METDTATATERLELLREELAGHGWSAEMRGTVARPYLLVVNPADRRLTGMVACQHGEYRWTWGPVLGAADEVAEVAARLRDVLREPGQ